MSEKLKSLSVYRRNILPATDHNEQKILPEIILSQTQYHPKVEKPVKEIQFSPTGEPEHVVYYQYDDNGFLLKEEMCEGDDTVMSKKTFESDDKGRILKEHSHYADGSFDTITYSYDQEGNLVEKTAVDDEGEQESQETFDYDQGRMIRHATYDADGFLAKEILTEYDDHGHIEETIVRDFYEGVEVRKEYEYDEKGLRKGFLVYNEKNEPVERVLFNYDEKGRVVKITDEDQRQKNVTTMQYNDGDGVVKQEESDRNGKLLNRVERIFDEKGRLLESKVYVDPHGNGNGHEYIMRNEYSFYENG